MKREKISIEEQAELLLNEFKEMYEPKNKIIDEIILKEQNNLSKGEIPQVVLKHVVVAIYRVVFIEKVTVGDSAYKLLQRMDKLSRSNGWLPFGIVNPF
ncbi:hypothetical protein [Clostridium saccharobutylicum]|uniref:Bacteriocin immunity protein n=1 Tax=Clostridium saccharobutylicum DSM 13864 TaxID=1345695 RepID=U5MQB6_CLOSA|nr:hypothetical protein [Clostridium saccharobutylicum]AGX42718.1 hypothetical protein CLSA_c17240 [Clostridium saccharobutylicum DSM 13864]AQR90011.1 hypothetical protein CLOSC_17180 [Clostridium saccharobutylicum]AQR99916.1 hypothetical protein CSACC_17250 [Clostridium saccharobutylicum]AQS09644.1 hypothetical protein CLOBY_17750 [Clostridium saccharobutylicum]AQS13900.1 hypothetical protein CLOSACC_17250 [Clostridium saccharobutylicum]